jgi:hypothetical protein
LHGLATIRGEKCGRGDGFAEGTWRIRRIIVPPSPTPLPLPHQRRPSRQVERAVAQAAPATPSTATTLVAATAFLASRILIGGSLLGVDTGSHRLPHGGTACRPRRNGSGEDQVVKIHHLSASPLRQFCVTIVGVVYRSRRRIPPSNHNDPFCDNKLLRIEP